MVPQFHCELLGALFALPALLSLEVIVLFVAASRAFRAIRQTQSEQLQCRSVRPKSAGSRLEVSVAVCFPCC